MKKITFVFCILLLLTFSFLSCKKESETLYYPPLDKYYPLAVGKMFIYRVDSTILPAFNASLITKSYQAMDTIESTFNDNSGRLSYRIFRYQRDTAGMDPWTFAYTFVATPANNQVEYVENNFRFIKLHSPIKNDFSWQGNAYINTKSDNLYLDGWNYTYNNFGQKFTTSGITYDSTVTVAQQDEFSPDGPFDPTLDYQQRNYSVEVYAKGIGLVYKDLLHWTWQKPKYEDGSYGIRLTLISHN